MTLVNAACKDSNSGIAIPSWAMIAGGIKASCRKPCSRGERSMFTCRSSSRRRRVISPADSKCLSGGKRGRVQLSHAAGRPKSSRAPLSWVACRTNVVVHADRRSEMIGAMTQVRSYPPRAADRERAAMAAVGRSAGGHRPWKSYVIWNLIGTGYGIGLAGMASIGIFVLPVAILSTILVATRPRFHRGISGLCSGLAVPLLYIGYLNRGGPGNVCSALSGGQSCIQEYTPWPFVGAALVLAASGLIVFMRGLREEISDPPH